jgi:hypothetical protein
VPIPTGLNYLDNSCIFVIGGTETATKPKKLFFFTNGRAQLKVLEGDETTLSEIDAPAADWATPNFPKFGLIHRNRLWAFMGNRAYASTTDNHENFTDVSALFSTVGPGDGGDCIAGFIYKGKMLIFKEGDIVYFLDDSDTDSTNWVFKRLGEGLGIASVHAATQVIDDFLVSNNTGSVTSYQAVQAFGDIKSGDVFRVSQVNQFFRQNTTYSAGPFVHATYYAEKHLVLFTSRTMYGTQNNCFIAMDTQDPRTPRYSLWKKDQPDCLSLRKDVNGIMRPIYGSGDGYVYMMDKEDRLVGTSAFTGEFQTPHLDFRHLDPSLAHKNKIFDYLGMTFQESGNWNVSVDVIIDGKFSETVTFKQVVSSNYLGQFVLGEDALAPRIEQTLWQPIKGSGRRISFRVYGEGANQNFAIGLLTVGFQTAAEDATRI